MNEKIEHYATKNYNINVDGKNTEECFKDSPAKEGNKLKVLYYMFQDLISDQLIGESKKRKHKRQSHMYGIYTVFAANLKEAHDLDSLSKPAGLVKALLSAVKTEEGLMDFRNASEDVIAGRFKANGKERKGYQKRKDDERERKKNFKIMYVDVAGETVKSMSPDQIPDGVLEAIKETLEKKIRDRPNDK